MRATVGKRIGRHASVHRGPHGIELSAVARIGIVAGAACAAVLAVRAFGRSYGFFDLKIYHGAVGWWVGGGRLYEFIAPDTTLGFTYPPFAALAMLPMAGVPTPIAGWFNVLASLAALAVVLAMILGPIADRRGWPRWFAVAVAVPLAAAIDPARETLGFGQVNLLLFALVMADLVGLRWRTRWASGGGPKGGGAWDRFLRSGAWAGVGIGLATAVKLTPALFILYLLVTRQWRVAVTAVGTATAATAATALVAGQESVAYFTGVLWQTDRVGHADLTPNQSLAGLLARLYDSVETPGLLWLAFAMLMLAVGLSRAANAHAEGDELAAFTLVGLTANVISPISWSHHLVFVIPAIVLLADAALRRRSASRGLVSRGTGATAATARRRAFGYAGPRYPVWFPPLTGMGHGVAAAGLYLLFLVAPIWPYEHRLPVSHYADGLIGVLAENSMALALIVLVVTLPWRPGAEPAFYPETGVRLDRRVPVRGRR